MADQCEEMLFPSSRFIVKAQLKGLLPKRAIRKNKSYFQSELQEKSNLRTATPSGGGIGPSLTDTNNFSKTRYTGLQSEIHIHG